MKGVQNALQRARARSSLASSKLFLGNGLSTMFRWYEKLLYSFTDHSPSSLSFYIMSARRSPTDKFYDHILLVNPTQFDYKELSCPIKASASMSIATQRKKNRKIGGSFAPCVVTNFSITNADLFAPIPDVISL